MDSVMYSHSSDEWATPPDIYRYFISSGYVDPCPLGGNVDALKMALSKDCHYFINPPFSKISAFVDHFVGFGAYCVWLVPVRTDTKWFWKMFNKALFIVFLRGRIHFSNSKNPAPFPCMLVCTSSANSFPAVFTCDSKRVPDFMSDLVYM